MSSPDALVPHDAATRVAALADSARAARVTRCSEQARRVEALAEVARKWLMESAVEVRAALAQRVHEVERMGQLPSLFTLMGTSRLERPYNTVLAWVFDPGAGHGAGRVALEALATRLELWEMARDSRSPGASVTVRGELTWPPEAQSSRMPDLLIMSPSTTLLVENKVFAGESGDGQYEDYLSALETLSEARGTRPSAWLCAPTRREVPVSADGTRSWSGCLTHPELADVLRRAAADVRMTSWGRVVCLLAAEQLAVPNGRPSVVAEARDLLSRSADTTDLRTLAQMRHLLARLQPAAHPSLRDHDEARME